MNRTVVFTVCDRPGYLAQTLEMWGHVRGLRRWRVEFYIEPTGFVKENLELIVRFKRALELDNVWAYVNDRRMGVLSNPCHAYSLAFERGADFVMLAEDDVMVSSDILEYLEYASRSLKGDQNVIGVCCHTHADGPVEEMYLASDFSPLGWGTWSDRWPEFQETWDHDYSSGQGSLSGWDWNIKYRVMGDRKFVFPRTSRTQHIGVRGTHMQEQDFPASVSASWVQERPESTYRII